MPDSVCPGCGLVLPSSGEPERIDAHPHCSLECAKLCSDLAYYTLSHGDPFFIHQVAVDAYAAQHAGPNAKPISAAFALIGLYLLFEKQYTGREVQLAHMKLAKLSKSWPLFLPPSFRGMLTVADPLKAAPGDARDAAIIAWAKSVWDAWSPQHHDIVRLLAEKGFKDLHS